MRICGQLFAVCATIAVVNNIDDDHPDYFKDIDQAEQSYRKFVALLPEDGLMLGYIGDPRVVKLMKECGRKTMSYGLNKDADWYAEDILYDENGFSNFIPVHNGEKFARIFLNLPGDYNVSNALCAVAIASHLGVSMDIISKACTQYHAAERRFEFHGQVDGGEHIPRFRASPERRQSLHGRG